MNQRRRSVPIMLLALTWAAACSGQQGRAPAQPASAAPGKPAAGSSHDATRDAMRPLVGKVLTVNGPISPDELGITLMHEHVFLDFNIPNMDVERWKKAERAYPSTPAELEHWNHPVTIDILADIWQGLSMDPEVVNRDSLIIDDEATVAAELERFAKHGGRTVVDVTSIGLSRSPAALRRVAEATGLNIVMGSGWYRAAWHPDGLSSRSVESLTEEIIREITVGVENTGIRAGIIGEIGTSWGIPDMMDEEFNVVRAAARASRRTGVAISIHTWFDPIPKELPRVIKLLMAEGTNMSRVVIGHANACAYDVAFLKRLLGTGVYVEFDLLGLMGTVHREWDDDRQMARAVVELIKAGYIERILLSHDVHSKVQLTRYGGNGYAYVLRHFVPHLKSLGVTDEQIRTLLVANPKRVLTIVEPS
jgi:phosphotriesterase-related protein